MSRGFTKLGDLVKISKGKKANNITRELEAGLKRFIQIDDLRNDNNLKYTSDDGVVVQENDIIIAWDGANAGTIGYGLNGIIGSTLAALTLKTDQIDPEYLGRFLQTKSEYLRSKCTGATIPHISKDVLLNLSVPIVPIEEQHRIVKILDLAQSLIEKRKQAIAYLDDYIKAVFLDMFGDPVSNPKGWEVGKFADLGTLERGKSKHRPRNAPELLGGEHPLIQTGDIANSNLYIENYVSTYSDIGLKQSKKWPKGTLCVTIAANIAKTGILAFDACFPDSVVGFVANPSKTNSIFIHYWMSFFQKILEDNAPESAQKNINLKILRDLEVINPPKELQDDFSNIVRNIAKVKQKMQAQLKELEDNFRSELQRAFRGEKNFSDAA